MGVGRVGHDVMGVNEDMGANGKSRKDAVDRRIERRAAGDERKRVEIALYRQMRWQRRVGPGGTDRLVEPDRIDSRPVGIGGELAARALRKADERRVVVKHLKRLQQPGLGRLASAREPLRGKEASP